MRFSTSFAGSRRLTEPFAVPKRLAIRFAFPPRAAVRKPSTAPAALGAPPSLPPVGPAEPADRQLAWLASRIITAADPTICRPLAPLGSRVKTDGIMPTSAARLPAGGQYVAPYQ